MDLDSYLTNKIRKNTVSSDFSVFVLANNKVALLVYDDILKKYDPFLILSNKKKYTESKRKLLNLELARRKRNEINDLINKELRIKQGATNLLK